MKKKIKYPTKPFVFNKKSIFIHSESSDDETFIIEIKKKNGSLKESDIFICPDEKSQ